MKGATPRPWHVEHGDVAGPPKAGQLQEMAAYVDSEGCESENAALIVRAVNAFDPLLAVAYAADKYLDLTAPNHMAEERMGDVIRALDTAAPGWRDWPTSSPSAR